MLSRRLLRIKALKAIYAHLQCDGDNLNASQKRLFLSIDKAYDLYFLLLQLPVAMADYSRSMQQIAREKHLATYEDLNPNTKFVDSAAIRLLENSDSLNDHLSARGVSWREHPEFVKALFVAFAQSEKFKSYMSTPVGNIKEDVELLEYLFVELLQSNEQITEQVEEVVEEISIMMSGDISYVLPLVHRTITSIRPSHTDIKVMKKYKNDDDIDFVRALFERSIVNHSKYQAYIEKFTANWDVERIVLMDNLIMVVAMAELLNFPDIPTKVTMDEYIEISKFYSTPGSSNFVNGILDRLTNSLNEEGAIKKSGRGLM
ncbi:MAG: transcription antitermination protein NusB [Rikenellaceae bacterium]